MPVADSQVSQRELPLSRTDARPGFVEEWSGLDTLAAGFAKVLARKAELHSLALLQAFHEL